MRGVGAMAQPPSVTRGEDVFTTETWEEGNSRYVRRTIYASGRTLSEVTRRDAATDTVWKLEHFLKDAGVVMIDTGDPLCGAADMFSMGEYTIVAMTEPDLFHRLLEKFAVHIHAYTERLAREYPGRLWRIFGPEYGSEPYLPPRFRLNAHGQPLRTLDQTQRDAQLPADRRAGRELGGIDSAARFPSSGASRRRYHPRVPRPADRRRARDDRSCEGSSPTLDPRGRKDTYRVHGFPWAQLRYDLDFGQGGWTAVIAA